MSLAWRYGFAILATAAAAEATVLLEAFLAPMRLFFLWTAVLVTAIVAGTGPGLLATALATAAAWILFFDPRMALAVESSTDMARLILFAAFAGALSVAVGMRRAAEARATAAAEENARLLAQANEANRAKDEFLATLSHELRTPVTAIAGWAHLLRIGAVEPQATQQALETIEQSARMQGELIEDLLDFARVTSGNFSLEVEPVDLARLVGESVASLQPDLTSKNLRLVLHAPPSLMVRGDARRLRQIVANLLSNAVKFSLPGGEVKVSLEARAATAILTVSDCGRGISAAFLPHVWDRFRQEDGSATREHGGLGLGLAVVRNLVELHGGTASAHSDGPGHGATFRVEIPLV